ncbi:DDE superfamily endonuclease [Pyrenophora tritici-repentis]|nr:DDE superfamily endonuclease [Pyrenophora tritici-repentis]
MANRLLRERGGKEVGKNWIDRFVQRNPELRTRRSRPYDHQRALCEDPALIKGWFELVQNTKAKYGIVDEDIYNFDETGFIMGKILSQSVITGSDKPGRIKKIQPGNREWVTLIQGVGATGTRIPAFLIFAGKVLISTWFTEDLPRDWVIQVSPTGWTNNDLALDWLRHFDSHARPVGTHRLLIINGHESHCSVAFRDLCEEMKIILLCMPPHSSHLLQPLDVGCFSPLKRAYGDAISVLARNRIHHISKETFLPAFKKAYYKAITPENIRGGFRGAGLSPHDYNVVISQLNVVLRTLTPPAQETTTWEPKRPATRAKWRRRLRLFETACKSSKGLLQRLLRSRCSS